MNFETPRGSLLALLGLVLVVAWHLGVQGPLEERIALARQARDKAATRLGQAEALAALKVRLDPFLAVPASGMNLVTRVEQMLTAAELRERLTQIRQVPPRRTADGSPPPKDAASVRLERLDLRQAVAALEGLDRLERTHSARRVELRVLPSGEASLALELEELPVQ